MIEPDAFMPMASKQDDLIMARKTNTTPSDIAIGTKMAPVTELGREHSFEAVAERLELDRKARESGRANLPSGLDVNPDEHTQFIIDAATTGSHRFGEVFTAENDAAITRARALMPRQIDTSLEKLDAERQVAKAKDEHTKILEDSYLRMSEAEREERNFRVERNITRNAVYQRDKTMFWLFVAALILVDAAINASFFKDVGDNGLLGGMLYAALASGLTVSLGLLAGMLGWRALTSHISTSRRILGGVALVASIVVAISLNVMLAHYRDQLGLNSTHAWREAAAVLTDPPRWFRLSEVMSYLMVAIGLIIFALAALKGRGGALGIVDPIWGYAEVAERHRAAREDYDRNQENYKSDRDAAYEAPASILRERLAQDEINVASIAEIVRDTARVREAISNGQIEYVKTCGRVWKRYWTINLAVRTTPAPAYYLTPPDFGQFAAALPDLASLDKLEDEAEAILRANRAAVVSFETSRFQDISKESKNFLVEIVEIEQRVERQRREPWKVGLLRPGFASSQEDVTTLQQAAE